MRVHTHLLMRRERTSKNERQKFFFFLIMPLAHFKVFYKNRKKISMNVSPFLPVITQACPPCIKYLAMRGKHAHCHTNTTPCSFIRSLTLFPQIRLPTLPPFLFRSCHVQLTSRAVRSSLPLPLLH